MRALDAALGTPWAMKEDALNALLQIAARQNETNIEALEKYRAQSMARAERMSRRGDVAILEIVGPMFRRANLFTEMSGATSYEILRRDLQVALEDESVGSILLNIDSPGGDANGTGELAKAIRDAREVKPVVAYVGGTAASAAYWLASAASEIVVSETAVLGSIGVVLSITDSKAADEARGLRKFEFISSQSPMKRADPSSKDGASQYQQLADDLADVFISSVAVNRNISTENVIEKFGAGGELVGAKAIAAGMADRLGTFEDTLAQLEKGDRPRSMRRSPRSMKGSLMSDKEGPKAGGDDLDAITAENQRLRTEVSALTAELTSVKTDLESVKSDLAAEKSAKADLERRNGIMALEGAKANEAQAKVLCDSGVSVEVAQAILDAAPKADSPVGNVESYEEQRAKAEGLNIGGGAPRRTLADNMAKRIGKEKA